MARRTGLQTDVALRAAGVALLGVAAYFGYLLFGAGPRTAGALDYLVAALAFLCASIGTALVWQGRHLFDQIALSSRWASHEVVSAGPPPKGRREPQ